MKRFSVFLAFFLLACCLTCRDLSAQQRFEYQEYRMAVPVRIIVDAENQKQADEAAQAAYSRFQQLDQIMSDYDPESELMRMCREAGATGQPVRVSDDLWRVLVKAKEISGVSNGAFDITVSPVVKLWRRARRLQRLPETELLEEAQSLVGDHYWELDAETQSVRILKDGVRMDLGGIAKGDAIDQAIEILKEHGIRAGLVDAGGDLRVYGTPSEPKWNSKGEPVQAWIIDITKHGQTAARIFATDLAVASSGDLEQHLVIDGVQYSHIIDPRTGTALTDHGAVTVTAPDAITADALASALSVLSSEEGLLLLEKYPGSAAIITRMSQGTMKTWASPLWKVDEDLAH